MGRVQCVGKQVLPGQDHQLCPGIVKLKQQRNHETEKATPLPVPQIFLTWLLQAAESRNEPWLHCTSGDCAPLGFSLRDLSVIFLIVSHGRVSKDVG